MKIASILKKILIFSSLALLIFAQEQPSYKLGQEHEYIETMTDENFTDIVNDIDPIIIKFYSPLCGISKAMALDYATVGETFTNEKKNLMFFQVDITTEKKTAESFGIATTPQIVLIINKQKLFFPYQYTKNKMIEWINFKLYNPTEEINEIANFQENLANNEVVVAYFGEKKEEYQIYLQIARLNEKLKFMHTHSQEIANHYGVEETASLIIFKQFDKERIKYKENEFELGKLLYFLKENAFPAISEVNKDTFQKIMISEKPSLFLFYDKKKHTKEFTELESISEQLKKDALLFTSELQTEHENEFAHFFGIKKKHLPMICMLEMPELKKYQLNDEINSDNIANFVALWKLGKLNFYLKSEEIPEDDEDEEEPVRKIVGKTFSQIVLDEKMDVIVNFCSKKEKLCRSLNPIYERVAEKYKEKKTLLFGSYDVDENQNEGVIIRKVPKIIFYPKNQKNNPIIFDNSDRSEATIQQFIEENLKETKEEL